MLNKYLLGKREKNAFPLCLPPQNLLSQILEAGPYSYTVSHLHDPAAVSCELCRADRAGHSPSGAYDLTTLEHFPLPL